MKRTLMTTAALLVAFSLSSMTAQAQPKINLNKKIVKFKPQLIKNNHLINSVKLPNPKPYMVNPDIIKPGFPKMVNPDILNPHIVNPNPLPHPNHPHPNPYPPVDFHPQVPDCHTNVCNLPSRGQFIDCLGAELRITRVILAPYGRFWVAKVIRMNHDSPLFHTGLRAGDYITRIGNVRLDGYEDCNNLDRGPLEMRFIRRGSNIVERTVIHLNHDLLAP